jgi:hypothetical protein
MNQSEPLPSTATAPQSGRGGARPPTRRHNASRPTCRPPVDRDQTDKARLRPHPHPRRGTAAGRAPDLDDSPPSGRPPPEPPAAHLRDLASARRHSAAGSSTSRWARRRPPHPPGTGRRGQRDRPPRPPHHPRDAAREARARSRSHCEGSRAPTPPTAHWAACWETQVGSGRPQTATLARQRFTFCLATRRSSLSLAVGASVGPALVDTSETVEGGTRT